MTPEQFVYWLQGFSEISGGAPTSDQWRLIQRKLSEVMERLSAEQATDLKMGGSPLDFDVAQRWQTAFARRYPESRQD